MGKKAFTLIEVLVVLIIIGLILGIAVPRAGSVFRSSLKVSSTNLAGIIKYAYDNAIVTQRIERLGFDFSKSQYLLEATTPGTLIDFDVEDIKESDKDEKNPSSNFKNVEGAWGKVNSLPTGVKFESIYNYTLKKEFKEGVTYLYFFPQGFTQSLIIRLKANKAGYYSIKINPISGACSIEGRYVDE